jgi:hypothetical protein
MPFTNRDLYLAILALQERARGGGRTLESYLLALWGRVRPLRGQPALSVDTFLRVLEEAVTAPAPPFDDSWRPLRWPVDQPPTFEGWEAYIIRQIRELRAMDEAGMQPEPWRYLLQAPDGGFWYHFDPGSYIEAGASGTFGGWEVEEDGESRIATPVFPLDEITWYQFTEFLHMGQWHE